MPIPSTAAWPKQQYMMPVLWPICLKARRPSAQQCCIGPKIPCMSCQQGRIGQLFVGAHSNFTADWDGGCAKLPTLKPCTNLLLGPKPPKNGSANSTPKKAAPLAPLNSLAYSGKFPLTMRQS